MVDVLVDTSAWVDFFRQGAGPVADAVDSLLDEDRVILCGVVEMELLQGVRDRDAARLLKLLGALRFVEATRDDYRAAGERLAALRRRGVTIPATDALIAAVCERAKLALLTTDRHFEHLSGVERLTLK
jgi:predicted nucleic acid-binding protein